MGGNNSVFINNVDNQADNRIRRYNLVLEGINRLLSSEVQAKTEEELGNACLSVALEVTGSTFGFIGEIGADGLLHDIAISDIRWNQSLIYDRTGHCRPPENFVLHGLYSRVVDSGKGFFTNDPPSHPESIGLPSGHTILTSFLGVPLLHEGMAVGMIAVANREGGYSYEQQEDLEAIVPAMTQALQRKKEKQERMKAEEELSRERSLLESVMQATDVMLVLFDHQFNFLWVNAAYAETCGMKPEEMVGKNHFTLYPDAENEAIFRSVLDSGKGVFYKDKPFVFSDQPERGVTYWDWSLVPVRGSGGCVKGLVFSLRETTKYKQVEDALRESEERLRLLGDNLPDSALYQYVFDPDGSIRFLYFSTGIERLNGVNVRDVLRDPNTLYRQVPPEYLERIFEAEARSARELSDFDMETPMKLPDGQIKWMRLHSRPYRMPNDRVIWNGVQTDITESKQAEEALKKAHETLEEKVKERTAELEEAYNSLLENERRLNEAQKIAHIGSWDWDIVNEKTYWSDEIYCIGRTAPRESGLTYNEFLSCVHPDDRDYVGNAIKEAFNGKPFSINHRVITADGEERIVHAQGEVIFDEKETPIRMRGIVQDITEHKKAEEKIQILANAVESSSDAIITLSLGGIITSWNKAAEQVYGYSAQDVIGESVSMLAPSHLSEETKKLTEMVIQGEKVHQYETLRLRKDGTIINISITLSPVFDTIGKLVAISGIVRDVTERIKAEEALRESESRLRQFYDSDMLGVFYFNLDGSITDANDKFLEIVGYTRKDLQAGRVDWEKMTPPEYRFTDERAIAEMKTTGVKEPREKEYIRKDSSFVPVSVGIAAFDREHDEGIAFVLDITEKKKAEKALANIEIARKKEIHHRIKNNLQVISSLLDLQADKFDDPKVIEAFKESQNRVISMALIHKELYKGEGADTLNFSSYIRELAENLFHTYCLNNKNIRLNMYLEENTFFDMDVAVPLGMIVSELVSNSFKHAFPGRDRGEIQIKLSKEEGKCKFEGSKSTSFILTVSDNGAGIPGNIDIEDLDTLGIQLVTTLVDQLDGGLELKRHDGTEFIIRFTVTEKDSLAQPG